MKLENQVCTYEQAKKLKELGVQGSSYCYWGLRQSDSEPVLCMGHYFEIRNYPSAYSVAELGVALPENHLTVFKSKYKDSLPVWTWETGHGNYGFADTEAQARAQMLIRQIEGGVITANEVNARLAAFS